MRGGVRSGAGRPKGEGSKVLRVPLGVLDDVNDLIAAYRNDDKHFLEKRRLCALEDANRVSEERMEKNKRGFLLKKFNSLNRGERRGLIKKFGNIEAVLDYMVSDLERVSRGL